MKEIEKTGMDIDEFVSQYKEACESGSMPEASTEEELLQYRKHCEKVNAYLNSPAAEAPVGFVLIEEFSELIDGKDTSGLFAKQKDEKLDGTPFPMIPVYVNNPTQVMAHTLKTLAKNAEEDGPMTAADLWILYNFLTPGGSKH